MPAATDYLPTREVDLVAWSSNFNTKINATPTNFGLSAIQATAYGLLHAAFSAAWTAANENSTRTPSAIQTKNTTKANLISGPNGIRELASIVQAFPGTTNTERSDLGLTVPDPEPSPVPVPEVAPILSVESVSGRSFKLRLQDAENPLNRGKPAGVAGATIFRFIGAIPPADLNDWTYVANCTRTRVLVELPVTVAPATQVWFTAFWFNTKAESSPKATDVFAFTSSGLSEAA